MHDALGGLKLVILDRDGVLNENREDYVTRIEDFVWTAGAPAACARISAAGLALAVVTNQSAVGRGLLPEATLDAIHARLADGLAALGVPRPLILHCPHLPADGCECRKPRPGLVRAALRHLGVAPGEALLVGDHESDLAAAAAAGCWSLHVRSGRGAPPTRPPRGYLGSVRDLPAVADLLTALRGAHGRGG
ncbi:D-glycero-beta-D-manno-heptose 1,7-bisphosphate 7-phosphatase [Plantactinospora mayteni]|uniref:D,D-heptose 1,7-bisphosphate phosphatase n=1 Tax=Plantactinospora mayteni TaxID=566021 RepID=A0ABQ4EFM9_9ACTN|nr:HAD-IIIA family hydrolase [Plantactinospora mayteni]GIG93518.1 D-glycero-beta-D-manno-heptose-1,7-bisphosphate 7-phosphatase [Plantactinospora mayteni]